MDAYQTSIYTAILIASAIIGLIIVYFVISMIRQQRLNQQLYKSKISAEITTLEKERARIAADLHDEMGPVLSSVKLKMNCLDITSAEDQAQLEKINSHIDQIILRMREISNDLMPTTFLRKGLAAAIEESIADNDFNSDLQIKFQHSDIPTLDPDKAIHVYRIIQEILHNTIKHARAKNLFIELSVKGDKLVLRCSDDGIGFNYSKLVNESAGLGLRSLLSRTEIMNGEMFVDNHRDKGTEYIFEIPLETFQNK
jgi:two-component system, NarL family, sensor kinase